MEFENFSRKILGRYKNTIYIKKNRNKYFKLTKIHFNQKI